MTETDPEVGVLKEEVKKLREDLDRVTDTVAELINLVARQSKLLEIQAVHQLGQLEKSPPS